jgi:peptidoglycan/xylan/chitin deacetylase (PgdA/CDA1 family)
VNKDDVMRRITAIACAFVVCMTASSALAAECANPNALGTSRTLVIDTTSHPRLGALQYNETLPLADHEVVLTFDDGPLGPYTTRILDLLAAECVKATYFLVGTMAQSQPALVRRIQREGHTVGTHSLAHPLTFDRMPLPEVERQVDGGIALVQAALGDQAKVAPFFRIPGLARSSAVDNLLGQRSLVNWSVDLVADDWFRHISADEIAKRALSRIAARGRGILLLHDIHPATALAMPAILRGLKAGGYRIVHVVPATADQPKTYTEPQQWAVNGRRSRMLVAEGVLDPRRPVPSRESLDVGAVSIAEILSAPETRHVVATAGEDLRLPRTAWTDKDHAIIPRGMISGTTEMNWPEQVHLASLSGDEIVWPVVKPMRTAYPSRKATGSIKTASSTAPKHIRPGTSSCKGTPGVANPNVLCKKPPVGGHQLSLTGSTGNAGNVGNAGSTLTPAALRSQYSF